MSISYVLDTTIVIQGVLEEENTWRVQTLFYRAVQPDDLLLHIPEFTLIECGNVLWKQVRFRGETAENAQVMLHNLRVFPLQTYASTSLLPRALEIALSSTLAVYDCIHIALAETLRCPLITVDQRQANAAEAVGVNLKTITDFPEYQED